MFKPEHNLTLGGLLDRTAAKYPGKDALVNVQRGQRFTYLELKEACDMTARGLLKLGVKKGDHVAIWANNINEWVLAFFGIAKIGAIGVAVNPNYRTRELEYILKQSDCMTLLLVEEYRDNNCIDTLNEICPELKESRSGKLSCENLPYLKNVVLMGGKRVPGMFTWEEFTSLGASVSEGELIAAQAACKPEDVINMQYTSGTTGFPKGVMLTHANIITNAYYTGDCQNYTDKERLCIPVPFYNGFGLSMSLVACVVYGATIVPVAEFKPEWVLEAVEKEKCTALQGVPTMWLEELASPDFHKYDLSSLRTGVTAGSPCSVELMREIRKKMIVDITVAYGQAESSPAITQTRLGDSAEKLENTVGRPIPGLEVKIFDPETGEECLTGVPGEICLRGHAVMKGYYKMPEATQAVISAEGWLHTGDLGRMDEKGYLKITGRLRDMILRGGESIWPREIEEFLAGHPNIQEAQVVGVPSHKYGEEVVACINLLPGKMGVEEEIREFCRGKIATQKIPKHIFFIKGFPVTASGEVQKFKLREWAIKELGLESEEMAEAAYKQAKNISGSARGVYRELKRQGRF